MSVETFRGTVELTFEVKANSDVVAYDAIRAIVETIEEQFPADFMAERDKTSGKIIIWTIPRDALFNNG